MLPSVAYPDNPSTSFAAKFVHSSINKNRCSINRVLVSNWVLEYLFFCFPNNPHWTFRCYTYLYFSEAMALLLIIHKCNTKWYFYVCHDIYIWKINKCSTKAWWQKEREKKNLKVEIHYRRNLSHLRDTFILHDCSKISSWSLSSTYWNLIAFLQNYYRFLTAKLPLSGFLWNLIHL
jgi:hypothetical protein